MQRCGAITIVGRTLRLPDEMHSVLAQGRRRVEIVEIVQSEQYWIAKARPLEDENDEATPNTEAMMQAVLTIFQRTSCGRLTASRVGSVTRF